MSRGRDDRREGEEGMVEGKLGGGEVVRGLERRRAGEEGRNGDGEDGKRRI